jgi:hypothetical protein
LNFIRSGHHSTRRSFLRQFGGAIGVAILAAVSPANCLAQQQEQMDVVKVSTDLVVFDAQVIDKKSKRTIGDLTKDDFAITENGVRQEVSYFSRDELPLSIILLLATNHSRDSRRRAERLTTFETGRRGRRDGLWHHLPTGPGLHQRPAVGVAKNRIGNRD